jgi:hypothetical protein
MYCKGCKFEEPQEADGDKGYCGMFQVEPSTCVWSKKYYCPACGGEGIVQVLEEGGSRTEECYCNGGFVPSKTG